MRGCFQLLHRRGDQSVLLSAMVLLGGLQFGLLSQLWLLRDDGLWPSRELIPDAPEFIAPGFGFPQVPAPADALEPEPTGDGSNWNRNRSEDWFLATIFSGGAVLLAAMVLAPPRAVRDAVGLVARLAFVLLIPLALWGASWIAGHPTARHR